MSENSFLSFVQQLSFWQIGRVVLVLLVSAALYWGSAWVLLKVAESHPKRRLMLLRWRPGVGLLVWGAALTYIALVVLALPTQLLLGVLATLGLAVGLGAQDLLRNLIAGLVIVFDRPFGMGDMVDIEGQYGEVTHIGLLSTRLQTFDDNEIYIPNQLLLQKTISDSNAGALVEQVKVPVKVRADADLAALRRIGEQVARVSPYCYLAKPVSVQLEEGDDWHGSVTLNIKAYVLDVRLERELASDILARFKAQVPEALVGDARRAR
ncbi:mechanosensitive ion channel family protein [Atopomonas sediminilitoris]|uniref:mechanosensitive ion channel family protein n=1 Tax=Atopomonas sediminilitoris TaxID=2919919 RepID=UPI001F4F0C9F|nr:mechanosensitive ion channel domain-containing protein [Atopomonas sediminilitoris]MCJ8168005.1 mechanosensitive ion channel family protein [Atopomonas sediminilitoris]